ncbi:MAG: putative Ig domain-containing protein [Candidatus Kerfeldbacteria bacterium]
MSNNKYMENQQDTKVKVRQINATKIMLGIGMIAVLCVGAAFGLLLFSKLDQDIEAIQPPPEDTLVAVDQNRDAMILLVTDVDTTSLISIIEKSGGIIADQSSEVALYATIPYSSIEALRADDSVKDVFFGAIQSEYDPKEQAYYEEVIDQWNTSEFNKQQPPALLAGKSGTELIATTKITEKQAIVDAVQSQLSSDLIGSLSVNNFEETYSVIIPATESRAATAFVDFVQMKDGLPVEDTYVHFAIKMTDTESVIQYASSNVYPELSLVTATPQLERILEQRATEVLGIDDSTDKASIVGALTLDDSNYETPIVESSVRYIDNAWRRVNIYAFKGSTDIAIVDRDNGEVFRENGLIFAQIQGNVTGRFVEFDPRTTGDSLTEAPLKNMKVWSDDNDVAYTDESGDFSLDVSTTPIGITAAMRGEHLFSGTWSEPWVYYENDNATESIDEIIHLNPTGNDEHSTVQVNAYYHGSFIHDWIESELGSQVSVINEIFFGLDYPVRLHVNNPDPDYICNASYDRYFFHIEFYLSGDGICLNPAYDTIIYHEYGHFVDHKLGGITNKGLSEGWADIFSTFATGQPLIGENYWAMGEHIRTADNDYQYPENPEGVDEHDLGQAWVGLAWDLRRALGAETAEDIVLPTILANSSDIPSAVLDLLIIDDNDANLGNGTPHLGAIINAAENHNLYPFHLDTVALITQPVETIYLSELFLAGENFVSVMGNANALGIVAELDDYKLYYGEGTNPDTWTQIIEGFTDVDNGVIGEWDVHNLQLGVYTLKLIVSTSVGYFIDTQTVSIGIIPPIQLTTDLGSQNRPQISGDIIVWQDERNGYDIYYYDLNNPGAGEQRITFDSDFQRYPIVDQNYIVWLDYTKKEIYYYDLNNSVAGEQLAATGLIGCCNSKMDMANNKIVFHDEGTGPKEIYLFDIINPGLGIQQLTDDSSIQSYDASMDGDTIVFFSTPRDFLDDDDIYYYQLDKPELGAQLAVSKATWLRELDFSDGNIVWDTYNYNLFIYNITSQTMERVFDHPADQQQPSIDGDYIVFMDTRSGNDDIYFYDLANPTLSGVQLTFDTDRQTNPAISGDKVVWMDNRAGGSNWDIYWTYINNDPVIRAIDDREVIAGSSFNLLLKGMDFDGDAIEYYVDNLPAGANLLSANGVFMWTPTIEQVGSYDLTFGVREVANPEKFNTVSMTLTVITCSVNEDCYDSNLCTNDICVGTGVDSYCTNAPVASECGDYECGWDTWKHCSVCGDYNGSCVGGNTCLDNYCYSDCGSTPAGACNGVGNGALLCEDGQLIDTDCRVCGCSGGYSCWDNGQGDYYCECSVNCANYPNHACCSTPVHR